MKTKDPNNLTMKHVRPTRPPVEDLLHLTQATRVPGIQSWGPIRDPRWLYRCRNDRITPAPSPILEGLPQTINRDAAGTLKLETKVTLHWTDPVGAMKEGRGALC